MSTRGRPPTRPAPSRHQRSPAARTSAGSPADGRTSSSPARRTASRPTGPLCRAAPPRSPAPRPARPAGPPGTSRASGRSPAGAPGLHVLPAPQVHQLPVLLIEEEHPLEVRLRRRRPKPAVRCRLIIRGLGSPREISNGYAGSSLRIRLTAGVETTERWLALRSRAEPCVIRRPWAGLQREAIDQAGELGRLLSPGGFVAARNRPACWCRIASSHRSGRRPG
jgi:hypothetical protein